MTDSLIIADTIETLGDWIPSTDPVCAGATYFLAPDYDLSAPQPTSDYVESTILDGEVPVGRRASNRQITLPIVITAPDRLTLAAAREQLLRAVNAQRWTR